MPFYSPGQHPLREKKSMKGEGHLGVVETIYEEEGDEDHSIVTASPSLSPSPSSLQCRIDAWSQATGRKADILINVGGIHFKLHKDRLTWKSGYFKRQITHNSSIIICLPLNITAKTFALVADFCYLAESVLTPFNVAALRVAADLLEMTEAYGAGNLLELAEDYFSQVISVNRDYASIVFRSCLALLPEAETNGFMASRCIEAILCLGDRGGECHLSLVDDVNSVTIENFLIMAESMNHRFTRSHDILYKIIDNYIKANKEKITDEQKEQLCNTIDSTKLSPENLLHSFQNPRMPLRFIVRSMFIHQLNTRRPLATPTPSSSSANDPPRSIIPPKSTTKPPQQKHSVATLGAMLQRDAAIKQVEQLTEAMDATSWRIQSLERDLTEMKKKLLVREQHDCSKVRSSSFRMSSQANKVERGQRGSMSSSHMRFRDIVAVGKENGDIGSTSSSGGDNNLRNVNKKNLRRRFIDGIKGVFGVSVKSDSPSHHTRNLSNSRR